MSSFGAALTGFVAAAVVGLAAASDDRIVVNPSSAYPEGPVAVGGNVYYAEMGADRVMRWDGQDNAIVWRRDGCGPTSVALGANGTLVVLCHIEESVARIKPSGETLAIVDRDSAGNPFMTPNASVNDGKGGTYFSSSGLFAPSAKAVGAVLYLDKDGSLRRVAEGIRYANGVALSSDGGTLFVSEHLARRVLAYDIAEDGSLSGQRVFLRLDDVVEADAVRDWWVGPDGLAIDGADSLYIAEYGGGRLIIVDKTAKLLALLDVPEKYVTAPALIDGGRRVFVTAPVSLFDPQEPGAVYSIANPAYRGG